MKTQRSHPYNYYFFCLFYHQQPFEWYTWKTMCTCRNISFLNISIQYLHINKFRILDKTYYMMITKRNRKIIVKSDKETTCKLYRNKYNVCIHSPPILKINSSEGIWKHHKDLYGRSTREYGLWFNYRRQEYVLTLYSLSHKNTAVERHTKHRDLLSGERCGTLCLFPSRK